MKMLECIKMLMDLNRVEQKQIARWRNVSANTVSVLLKGQDIKCCAAVDVLEYMGYEVIVREKRGRRSPDEIIIDLNDDGVDARKIMLRVKEQEEAEAKERYYSEKDRELLEKYPKGMGVNDLIAYFGRQHSLIHKYFDGFFFRGKVPVEEVMRIMRKYCL